MSWQREHLLRFTLVWRWRVSREFYPCGRCAVVLFACVGLMGCANDEATSPSGPDVGVEAAVAPIDKTVVAAPSVKILDAAWSGDLEAVRQHIAAGTDLNTRGEDGGTPLHAAAARGNDEVVTLLLAAGVDVDAKKADGGTALHSAAFLCHEGIVRALLSNGADKMIRNGSGATAYDGVAGSFDDVKPIYGLILQIMGPLGLELDYERIEAERPNIAELLSAQ